MQPHQRSRRQSVGLSPPDPAGQPTPGRTTVLDMSWDEELPGFVDRAAARHRVPGAAVAVGTGDALFEAATGVVNRNTGVAATPDSLFQIGSVTKVWTASLVLQLVDDGLVALVEPVRESLPTFCLPDAHAAGAVTLRHLLSHTGGFEGDLFEDTGRGADAVPKLVDF